MNIEEKLQAALRAEHEMRIQRDRFAEDLQRAGRNGLVLLQELEAEKVTTANLYSKGHRLALELECLINDIQDTAIVSKWFDSAMEALEEWRK